MCQDGLVCSLECSETSRVILFLQKVIGVSDLEELEERPLRTLWEWGCSTWTTGEPLGWPPGVGSVHWGKGLHPIPEKAEVRAYNVLAEEC